MADKITKLLARLPKKHLILLEPVIKQVMLDELAGLDVKALKGKKAIYRARVGNYRIIFIKMNNRQNNILSINKRNERTYKDA